MLPVGDVPDGAVWSWGSTSGRSGWIEEGVLRRGRCRGEPCRQAARAVWVTDAAPGMWSVCVEYGVFSKAELLVVLSDGAFAGNAERVVRGAGAAPIVFAPGRMVLGAGGALDVERARGWSCCWPWLHDRAAWGLPHGGVRGSTWVFSAYERGSARLERSRSGVIVPLCEERGERIMPERGAAAPGMSAGSLVAGGGVSAGGAGRGAVEWGCFAGKVEWADRRGGCCAGRFCAGRDDLGTGGASGLCWAWGAADRRAVFGGGPWPRGIDG